MSRKGGTKGDGWAHPNGENSMAVSGLGREKPLDGAWWAISLVNGPSKWSS